MTFTGIMVSCILLLLPHVLYFMHSKGFCIGLVTVMQVKATSPLTHNISGTAKAAVQSLLAFYIWGNQATFKGLLGIFLVLFGSGFYTWVQMQSTKSILPVSLASK
jgi:hypothetical protein